jgi:uncharacterized protein YjiS (DUF1127 family)
LLCIRSKTIWHRKGKDALEIRSFERITDMSATETPRPAPLDALTTYHFDQTLDRAFSQFAAWNDARVTRKALAKLTDRELDDIGLCRGDIEAISATRV